MLWNFNRPSRNGTQISQVKVRPQPLPYSQAVQLFVDEKEKSRRESTADAYKGLLNRLPLTGPVADFTHEEVRRKLARIKTPGAPRHLGRLHSAAL
jgi:hypothetical protein